jgi:cell division protein FtsB
MSKNKRKIIPVLIFAAVFVYLTVSIIGLMKDIRQKRIQELELRLKIQQEEELYDRLFEEFRLMEEMDPVYMEKLARALGMLKEGEVLFEDRKD